MTRYAAARLNMLGSIKSYIEVTKPRSVFLLSFTAVVMSAVAARGEELSLAFWLKNVACIMLACAGANAVSCYVDRDLDAAMERTKRRPIPSGRISPPVKALYWGLLQFMVSFVMALSINRVAAVCVAAGMIGYVGVYSLWLKRKTTWNIILGGISGGLPALYGWAAVKGSLDLLPVLVALMVILWIPNHIWNLAIYFREDYARVQVPMLPVVCSLQRTLFYILLTVVGMIVLSLAIYHVGPFGKGYLVTAIIAGSIILGGNLYLLGRGAVTSAWWLYKLSSPYLFVMFLAMLLS